MWTRSATTHIPGLSSTPKCTQEGTVCHSGQCSTLTKYPHFLPWCIFIILSHSQLWPCFLLPRLRQDKFFFFFSCKKHLLGISFVTMETREDISGHPSVLPSLFPWGFVACLCFCGCPVLHICHDYPLPDKHFASREHALVIAYMGVWLEKRMGKCLDGRVVAR